ncbi:MAG: DUF1772 domain-containing protein [Acidimicrobiales bacterium]
MDDKLVFGLTFFTVLGTGLMAGLFFVFSVFMMRALGALPGGQGAAAMQSTNRAIVTPLFLLAFVGTAITCLVLAGFAIFDVDGDARVWLLVGSALYLVGVIVLTGTYHVPRNDALDAVDPDSADGLALWADYLKSWTALNHVRTVASLAALGSFVMAIRAG